MAFVAKDICYVSQRTWNDKRERQDRDKDRQTALQEKQLVANICLQLSHLGFWEKEKSKAAGDFKTE